MTTENISIKSNNFNVNSSGKVSAKDVEILGGDINMKGNDTLPTIRIYDENKVDNIEMYPSNINMRYEYPGAYNAIIGQYLQKGGYYVENESTGQSTSVWYDGIETPILSQTSLANQKKDFEKYSNCALKEIKKIDIYKYHLKPETNIEKKHLGFVIGDKYNYSKEVTNTENKGVDLYSFISLCCKAIQEQQEQIEEQNKRIEMLENIIKGGN